VTKEIHILNASSAKDGALRSIIGSVKDIFGVPASLTTSLLDLQKAFDDSRGQYSSNALLLQILSHNNTREAKQIAIVDVDLFIPVLTFIFGEAQFEATAAIVSTHRLNNEFYGLSKDGPLLLQRLEKEIVHELGHTFGLYHCHQFECVMRSSTYVEEIDLKRVSLCPSCAETLKQLQNR
jgi:archaemetzincin